MDKKKKGGEKRGRIKKERGKGQVKEKTRSQRDPCACSSV